MLIILKWFDFICFQFSWWNQFPYLTTLAIFSFYRVMKIGTESLSHFFINCFTRKIRWTCDGIFTHFWRFGTFIILFKNVEVFYSFKEIVLCCSIEDIECKSSITFWSSLINTAMNIVSTYWWKWFLEFWTTLPSRRPPPRSLQSKTIHSFEIDQNWTACSLKLGLLLPARCCRDSISLPNFRTSSYLFVSTRKNGWPEPEHLLIVEAREWHSIKLTHP